VEGVDVHFVRGLDERCPNFFIKYLNVYIKLIPIYINNT